MFESFLNRVTPHGKEQDSKEITNEADNATRADNNRREKKKKGPNKGNYIHIIFGRRE